MRAPSRSAVSRMRMPLSACRSRIGSARTDPARKRTPSGGTCIVHKSRKTACTGATDGAPKPSQVHIARGPVGRRRPQFKKDRPLEHELVAIARFREPVQEPLVRIAGEQIVEVFPTFARPIEQALPDRRSDVPWLPTPHRIASI